MGMLDGIAGAGIGAAASVGSALLSANSAAHASAQSEYAAKHRYQWAVEDLRKAGLNPIIAATSGGLSGAASPNYQQGDFSGLGQAGHAFSAVQNSNSQKSLTASNIQLQSAQTANQMADIPVKQEQAKNFAAQNENIASQNELLKQQAISEAQRRVVMQAQAGYYSAGSAYQEQQRFNAALDATKKQVESDYYKTPVGAESVRVGVDAKPGGNVGLLNTGLQSFNRWLNTPPPSSAKQSSSQQGVSKYKDY